MGLKRRAAAILLACAAAYGAVPVEAAGAAWQPVASVPGIFDIGGPKEDGRLVVAGSGKLYRVDPAGAVTPFAQGPGGYADAPALEGGLAVAPLGFSTFGGELIAPDELSGNIYAIDAHGASTLVVRSGLPPGGDIGVEGVGSVPPGFSRGGTVFYSDRATPGSPHPGTDSLLGLSAAAVSAAGVHDGDLLAVTEGGDTMIGVHCDTSCSVLPVVATPTRAHGEGHPAFTLTGKLEAGPSPSPTVRPSPNPRRAPQSPAAFLAVIVALVVLGAGALAVVRARWR